MKVATVGGALGLFSILFLDVAWAGSGFTHLEIDNHPCTPENLKVNIRKYRADHEFMDNSKVVLIKNQS